MIYNNLKGLAFYVMHLVSTISNNLKVLFKLYQNKNKL